MSTDSKRSDTIRLTWQNVTAFAGVASVVVGGIYAVTTAMANLDEVHRDLVQLQHQLNEHQSTGNHPDNTRRVDDLIIRVTALEKGFDRRNAEQALVNEQVRTSLESMTLNMHAICIRLGAKCRHGERR